jgi:hypothetical protein
MFFSLSSADRRRLVASGELAKTARVVNESLILCE